MPSRCTYLEQNPEARQRLMDGLNQDRVNLARRLARIGQSYGAAFDVEARLGCGGPATYRVLDFTGQPLDRIWRTWAVLDKGLRLQERMIDAASAYRVGQQMAAAREEASRG